MKISPNICFAFLLILLSSSALKAQQRWSFSAKPGIGINFYDRMKTKAATVPIETWGPYEKPFYTSHLHYQMAVEADYSLFSFLKPSLAFSFSQVLLPHSVHDRYYQLSEIALRPALKIDPLYYTPDKAFYLIAGFNAAFRNQKETYNGNTYGGAPQQRFVSIRRGFLVNGFVGFEWEQFFSPHFGYTIGMQYFPPFAFRPSTYIIKEYVLEGEKQNAATGKYHYVEDQKEPVNGRNLRQETFYMQNFYLNAGVKYRF